MQINTSISIIEIGIETKYVHYLIMLFKTHFVVVADDIISFKYVVFCSLNIS